MSAVPEPWLRGPLAGVDPLVAPLLYSFQQAREDVAFHTAGLTADQLWATPYGLASAGFHIRHISGSTRRLTAYLEGRQLSPRELSALDREAEPGASRDALLSDLAGSFEYAEQVVRTIDPASLCNPRAVGRQHLPATVVGLLTHIAEHTQRHVGQVISAAKLARAT